MWAGNDELATYEAFGGNLPLGNDQRLPENLFDNDPMTMWHGEKGVHGAKITVTFVTTVRFQYLDWTMRHDQIEQQERYKDACLYANYISPETKVSCFPDDVVYTAGKTYRITGDAVHYHFLFQLPREGAGAELKFYYSGKLTFLASKFHIFYFRYFFKMYNVHFVDVRCPFTHPFPFHNGKKCCNSKRDESGNLLKIDSQSCYESNSITCPADLTCLPNYGTKSSTEVKN